MSDLIKHIVVADFMGEVFSYSHRPWINNGITGLVGGIGSHIILDYIDNEFVVNWLYIQEIKYALPFLLFELFFSIIILWMIIENNFKSDFKNSHLRINFILGGLLPDIIDGFYVMVNPLAWLNGNLLFPWHISNNLETPMSMYKTILLSSGLIIIRYLVSGMLFNKEIN
ncbi:MAG: hypothetical protein ACOCQS_00720 [Bacillota bacterium]